MTPPDRATTVLEPFEYGFMQRAMVAAALIGGVTAAVGVFVILRRLAYIGHGLAHSIFGGAVVSFTLGINFFLGASVWGAFSVFLINQAARRRQIGGDAAIGIITTAAFAIGIAVISRSRSFTRDFEAALFGEILGITSQDLYVIVGMIALVGVMLFIYWKQLVFITFDRDVAGSYGVSVSWVDAVFALVLAATVVASLQVLGVTLIAAALVIPPVVARMSTDSFSRMFVLAVIFGVVTGFLGVYISWFVDVSSGATVVLTQAALFALSLAWGLLGSLRGRSAARRAERLAGLERALNE